MKIQSIEDLQKGNRPVLTKPTPEKKSAQSMQKAVEQAVAAAEAARDAVNVMKQLVEDTLAQTSDTIRQLEDTIDSLIVMNKELSSAKPVRLMINRDKKNLATYIDAIPLKAKK